VSKYKISGIPVPANSSKFAKYVSTGLNIGPAGKYNAVTNVTPLKG
jgi:hypothetical protein